MRHHSPRRNAAHLERVLEGRPTTPDPLIHFVSALQAPGARGESVGLDGALAAFADPASVVHPPTTQRRPSMLKSLAGKLLAAKVLAITASTVAVGSVAYAASTGDLPNPLPHSSHAAATARTHVPTAVPAGPSATATKTAKSAVASKGARASRGASPAVKHPSASPSPSLVGLCHAWLAHSDNPGKAEESPAFTYLVNAAGGKSSVTSWCTKLLSSKDDPAPSSKPSTPPGQAQKSEHPTGKPSSHPTGKPTSHPTGNRPKAGNPGSQHNGH
jgi:hypothetical protein